jgi:hypothetical protein
MASKFSIRKDFETLKSAREKEVIKLTEEKGYKNEEMRRQVMHGEVRLVHPNYGMIVMMSESEAYEIDHPEHYGSAERKVFMPATLILSKKAVGLLEEEVKNN